VPTWDPKTTEFRIRGVDGVLGGVVLPGAETMGVGSNLQRHVDLVTGAETELPLLLERAYNSFFRPTGEFGTPWTLDLPRLHQRRVPLEKRGDAVTSTVVHYLTTPLGSIGGDFTRDRWVPELGIEAPAPARASAALALLRADSDEATYRVICRNGESLLFNDEGFLVERRSGGRRVVYRWDPAQQLVQMLLMVGDREAGRISLDYDAEGRVARARSSEGRTVTYQYGRSGRLVAVQGPEHRYAYRYEETLLTEVSNGSERVRFGYGPRGELRSMESPGHGSGQVWELESDPEGTTLRQLDAHSGRQLAAMTYGRDWRPIREELPGGGRIEWEYRADGSMAISGVEEDGRRSRLLVSDDGRTRELRLPGGSILGFHLSADGRTSRIESNDRRMYQQTLDGHGNLFEAKLPQSTLQVGYREDLTHSALLIGVPREGEGFSQWTRLEVDARGRITSLKDDTGAEIRYDWGEEGLRRVVSGDCETQLHYDRRGRVRSVVTSSGRQCRIRYGGDDGDVSRIEVRDRSGVTAREFVHGRLVKLESSAGERVLFEYGAEDGALKEVRSNAAPTMRYGYMKHILDAVEVVGHFVIDWSYDEQGRLVGRELRPVT
jgi:YD repeat-containing protein